MPTHTIKHANTYQHDCPACIHDPRTAGDESLRNEHVADVRLLRAMANPSEGAKRLLEPPRNRTRRHRKTT